jgi:hypothetical protein
MKIFLTITAIIALGQNALAERSRSLSSEELHMFEHCAYKENYQSEILDRMPIHLSEIEDSEVDGTIKVCRESGIDLQIWKMEIPHPEDSSLTKLVHALLYNYHGGGALVGAVYDTEIDLSSDPTRYFFPKTEDLKIGDISIVFERQETFDTNLPNEPGIYVSYRALNKAEVREDFYSYFECSQRWEFTYSEKASGRLPKNTIRVSFGVRPRSIQKPVDYPDYEFLGRGQVLARNCYLED